MAFKIPSLEEMERVHEQTGRTQVTVFACPSPTNTSMIYEDVDLNDNVAAIIEIFRQPRRPHQPHRVI